MGKPSHETWVKQQQAKRQKQSEMDVATDMSELRDLEAAIEDDESDPSSVAPMDVDKPDRPVVAERGLKLKKRAEKASVKKLKTKKAIQTVKYSERLEARMLSQTKKSVRGKKKK
jgi:hypothetical protein